MNKVSISFLHAYPSLTQALQKTIGISRSQLLKRGLEKKILNQRVNPQQTFSLPIGLVNWGRVNPRYSGQKIAILQETEDLIAVSKPYSVHCHPLHYDESDNLLSALISQGRWDLMQVNKENYDRGLLYRLDYETSGVMVLAKKDEVYQQLRDHFHAVVKQKTYTAIVEGRFETKQQLMHRLSSSGKKIMADEKGKEAEIEVTPLQVDHNENLTLIKIELYQGLRHQIRVQLSLNQTPILGDFLYGAQRSASRLFLHCYKYKFELKGEILEFEDPSMPLFREFFDFNGEF